MPLHILQQISKFLRIDQQSDLQAVDCKRKNVNHSWIWGFFPDRSGCIVKPWMLSVHLQKKKIFCFQKTLWLDKFFQVPRFEYSHCKIGASAASFSIKSKELLLKVLYTY